MKYLVIYFLATGLPFITFGQNILDDKQIDEILAKRTDLVRYVDFHVHTTNKNYYNHIPSPQYFASRSFSATNIEFLNWHGEGGDVNGKFNNFKSFRQADFGILSNSGASILSTSITPTEKRLTSKRWLLPPLPISMRAINHYLVSGLSFKRLKTLHSKEVSSFSEFMGEYRFLKAQRNQNENNDPFYISLVKDKAELIQNFIEGKTSLVLSLEGGHILHGNVIAQNKSYDSAVFTEAEKADIMSNIDSIKNLDHRVFFITIGHFCWNGIVGFSKTIDMDDWKRSFLTSLSRSPKFRAKFFLKAVMGL